MNASDVMVRNVITVSPDTETSVAIKLLVDKDISALPVVDGTDGVVGIISEADLFRREEIGTEKHRPWWLEAMIPSVTLATDFAKSHGRRVGEIMSERVVTAEEDTSLSKIATLLERHRIKRIPIVKDGKLVGIVSRSNLIQALASMSSKPDEALAADRALRFEILNRLKGQSWTHFDESNVVVSDGIVHLWGLIDSPQQRKALFALVEEVAGVGKVEDETISAYR
jgi:CBS-domain-containing membrane protein